MSLHFVIRVGGSSVFDSFFHTSIYAVAASILSCFSRVFMDAAFPYRVFLPLPCMSTSICIVFVPLKKVYFTSPAVSPSTVGNHISVRR